MPKAEYADEGPNEGTISWSALGLLTVLLIGASMLLLAAHPSPPARHAATAPAPQTR